MRLFWDTGNWQALAKVCHDRKTAREDGAFGRPPAPSVKKNSNRRGGG
jgi:5-methylcytosine-specific restriction endonuclease McrA